jgi:hypothetical protein
MISHSIVLWDIVSKPQYVKYTTSHLDMKEKNPLKINIIIIITHHNAICLYRLNWFVTFLCNILNLPVVTKVFSWKDRHLENVKSYMSHLQQYTTIFKMPTLQTYLIEIFMKMCTPSQKKRQKKKTDLYVFIRRHVVYVPPTCRGILTSTIYVGKA